MPIFAIPNPKKSLTVDFPISEVKRGVLKVPLANKKYKLHKSNEAFNQYTFDALEFLSVGVYIDINLNSVLENKTEVNIEIRRKIGSFDKSYEVTNANEHIEKIVDAMSMAMKLSDEALNSLGQVKTAEGEKPKSKVGKIILIVVIVYAVSYLIMKLTGKN